jgi:hypothetical protein
MMLMTLIITCMVGLQPACDRSNFRDACGDLLKGEHKSIANAIFEAYLDQISEIKDLNPLAAEKESVLSLLQLTQSLALLDGSGLWEDASRALSRSVLLQARQAANPWPATVWIDLSVFNDINVSTETNNAIDLFLQKNYTTDLEERYTALAAITTGNTHLCEQLTVKAMARWVTYQQIIEPYMTISAVQFAAYPKLDTGQVVRDAMLDLVDFNSPELEQRYAKWENWHNAQTQATIGLIYSARSTYSFDPWSPRCGASMNRQSIKLQQQLLQLSATVRDKNKTAIKSLQEIQ